MNTNINTDVISAKKFQRLLLIWFAQHGRKNLPWQQNKTPYHVWLSEIMLQQTQVATVVPYFQRFIQIFPTLTSLAQASEDEVLHLWAGLGYYRRAHHLHCAAKKIVHDFENKFPDNLIDLQKLPGVGLSTAAAILSLAFNIPATILDGNVKRVLTRLHGITLPLNQKNSENLLWEIAKFYTPKKNAAQYSQAMMDLGATVCTRHQPQCLQCPLQNVCVAKKNNLVHVLPIKKQTQTLQLKHRTFLLLQHIDNILLYKRSAQGIWQGLWSLPELTGKPNLIAIKKFMQKKFGVKTCKMKLLSSFKHSFTHFHLQLHPVLITSEKIIGNLMEDDAQIWYNVHQPKHIGLPKPIKTILERLP